MSDFAPGFASRHDRAGEALLRAFGPAEGFAAADIADWARPNGDGAGPRSFAPDAAGPRHFSPADRDTNPTEGWDPFDPGQAGADAKSDFLDPVAAAHEAGFAEGKAAALAEAKEHGDRDRQFMEQLQEALAAGGSFDRDKVARQIRQTVLHLVRRTVGDVDIGAEMLGRRIDSAIELLADSAESAMLRVHPDDLALVRDALPKTVFPVSDTGIARGSFVMEAASTVVEDGPELWIEQLGAALDQVALPPQC